MLLRVSAMICVLLLGCGKGESADPGPGRDWSAEPLAPVVQRIGGAEVSLSLPRGLRLDSEEPDRIHWVADQDDYFSEPSVTLATVATPPDSVERAVEYAMPGDTETVARKEPIEGGFAVTTHSPDRGLVQAYVWKQVGDQPVSCLASQARRGGVPRFEATTGWLESICGSLAPAP
jgi:hypothetical protein